MHFRDFSVQMVNVKYLGIHSGDEPQLFGMPIALGPTPLSRWHRLHRAASWRGVRSVPQTLCVWSPNFFVVVYSRGFPSLFSGFRCECLSGLCGFPVCEVGSTPRIVSRGDGTPGKCCDVFECVNGTWGFSCSQRVYICGGGGGRVQSSCFCLLKGRHHAQGVDETQNSCSRSHHAVGKVRKGILTPSFREGIFEKVIADCTWLSYSAVC